MNEFERCGKCIIDNNESMIVDTSNNTLFYFDFPNMTVLVGGKTTKYPIRYMDSTKRFLLWQRNSWQRLRTPDLSKAAAILFNNHNDRILLGDIDE